MIVDYGLQLGHVSADTQQTNNCPMSRRQKDLFPELTNGKKYVSDIPELVAEWHPTKN